MKLKIRVKKKDFMYFILISIVLFLGCSILAINFLGLSKEGNLVGFNLFKYYDLTAFSLSLVFFVVSMIFIFTSVSSTIFNFEKGGLGLVFGDKDEKGYNRWLTTKEMKNAWCVKPVVINQPTSDAGGIVFINDGKKMWVDDGEYHTLIIGQSGSGKTSALVDPQVYSLCKHGESMIITDPKGEIYRRHANRLKANGYNIVCINFRNPREGNAWNPLTIPYRMYKQGKIDKAQELLEDISQNIFISPKNQNDPFWESASSAYFSVLGIGLFEDAKENEVSISSIEYMSTCGEEKNGLSTYAKDYFSLKGESSSAYKYAKATITAPNDTKSSVLSVFQDKIKNFASRPELSEMLSYSDFNMEDIGKEKTAVFLIVHDEKTTYHSLATIFIKQLYEVLIDVAHKNPKGELKFRTNFILDEFANMPALKDVTSMVTAARSRKIRFTFIIQNFAQLDEEYGDKNAETIRSNCGNTIYLLTNELSALEEISKLCGEVKSKEKEKTVSTPLVTVTDLQKMKRNEIIVIRMRMRPFRTVLKGAYEVDWGDHFDEAVIPERESSPIKLFDMKQYVKEEKRKKTMEAINAAQNNPNSNTPSNPNSFSDPFKPMNDPFSDPFKPMNDPFSDPFKSMNDPFANPIKNSQNPFADPFKPTEPFNGIPNNTTNTQDINNKKDDVVDIDELVKNIDAQIAELEKEQEKKKTSDNNKSDNKMFDLKELDLNMTEEKTLKTDEISEKKEDKQLPKIDDKNKVIVDNSSVIMDNQVVTDDQYFDDFFGDDE